jgi:hypothetical protein
MLANRIVGVTATSSSACLFEARETRMNDVRQDSVVLPQESLLKVCNSLAA